MKLKHKYYFSLFLVVSILLVFAHSAAAVSELEKKISKRNLKLYTEKYGVAKLKEERKEEIDKIFARLSAEAEKDAPKLDFQYRIIDAPVMNAAYLGAGRMILFKGLVKKVEENDEIAAIIAHELGHGVNDDIGEKLNWMQTIQLGTLLADLAGDGKVNEDGSSHITAIALNLLQKSYSRSQEREADYYSVFLTERAGYNYYGAAEVMKLLKKKSGGTDSELLEIFAEHPNLDKRIDYLTALAKKIEARNKYYYAPISTARRFAQGIIRDNIKVAYDAYSTEIQNRFSLTEFKARKEVKRVQNRIADLSDKSTYQIELRNQAEETARVAILFKQKKVGLALDLKQGDYGWKIANPAQFY